MDKAAVLNRVYASSLLSRAKTVMFYLVNRANKEFTCFPAVPTIARETGLSERTVQRALKELCDEGFIEKSSRYRDNGGQSSNLYKLLIKEEVIHEEVVLPAKSQDVEASETKVSQSIEDRNTREIEIINFSFFTKVSQIPDCHLGGDIYVPP